MRLGLSPAQWIRKHRWPLGIFLLALAARAALVLSTRELPLLQVSVGDALHYEALADRILAGDLLAGKQVFFHSSIGYPYILALIWALFGKSVLIARLFQTLVAALNVVVIYALARRLAGGSTAAERRRGEIIARVSGLLLALYGYLAFLEQNLLMTAYELLAIDLALLLLVRFLQQRRWRDLAGAGIAFGFGSLGRPNVMVVAIVLAIFIAATTWRAWRWRLRAALAAAALIIGLTSALVLPITLRNMHVAGDPVLLSCNAGINFWIGNHKEATGTFRVSQDMDHDLCGASSQAARRDCGRPLSAGEVSDYWFQRTLDTLLQNPRHALSILTRKAWLFFQAYEIPNQLDFYFVRDHGGGLLWGLPVAFWWVVPLALAGLVSWRRRDRCYGLIVTYLLLYFLMVVGLFVTGRYRAPVIPVLMPFAAATLVGLFERLRQRSWGRLARLALVLIPAALLVNWGRAEPLDPAHSWAWMAHAYERQGKSAEAQAALRQAMQLEPNNPHTYNNLGLAARQRGDLTEAERLLRRAYELSRENPDNAANLAGVLAQRGTVDEAVRILEAALQKDPANIGCLTNLTFIHHSQGRTDLAWHYARETIRLETAVPQTYHLLAAILASQGDLDAALARLTEGVQRFPQNQSLWVTRTQLELQRGNITAARRSLEQALRRPGQDPRIAALRSRLPRGPVVTESE